MKKNRLLSMVATLICLLWCSLSFGQLTCTSNIVGGLTETGTGGEPSLRIYAQDIVANTNVSDLQISYDNVVFYDFLDFYCEDLGDNTVYAQGTINGTLQNCFSTITIDDIINPTPYAQNITVSLNGGSSVTIDPSQIDAGSFDNCGIESMSLSQSTFTENGAYEVKFTVTDGAGNSDFANVLVTVTGGTPVCNDLLQISLDISGKAVAPAHLFVEGNGVYDVLEVSLDNIIFGEDVTFDCDDIDDTKTVYVRIEEEGNTYNCSSEVEVDDKLAPIVVVNDFTIDLSSDSDVYTLSIEDIDDGSYDNCSGITRTLSQTEFSANDWGKQQVYLMCTDAQGLTNSGISVVTVLIDGEANAFQCKSLQHILTGTSDVIYAEDFITDDLEYDDVLLSFSEDGPFFNNTLPSCDMGHGGTTTVYIKRIFNHKEFNCEAQITVFDEAPPIVRTKDIIFLELVDGEATLTVDMVDDGSFDPCSEIEMELSKTLFTEESLGMNTVFLTATDENGNTASSFSKVSVDDGSQCNTGFIIRPQDITVFDPNGTKDFLDLEEFSLRYGYNLNELRPYTNSVCDDIFITYSAQFSPISNGFLANYSWTIVDWKNDQTLQFTNKLTIHTGYSTALSCYGTTIFDKNILPVQLVAESFLAGGPYDLDNMTLEVRDANDNLIPNNVITDQYLGRPFYYTVMDNTTGNTCWGSGIILNQNNGCRIFENMVETPLPLIELPGDNIDAKEVTPEFLTSNYGYQKSDVLITWPHEDCTIASCSYEDDITENSDGSYTIERSITMVDWSIFDPAAPDVGIWNFTQTIQIGAVSSTPVCNEFLNISLIGIQDNIVDAEVFIEGNPDYEVLEVSLDNVNFGESVSFNCSNANEVIPVYVHIVQDGIDYNCTSQASLEDKLAPVAIVKDFTIDLASETDTYTLLVDDINNGSADNCPDVTYTLSQTDFSSADWGENSVVLTVTDIGDNSVSATSTVTVLVNGQTSPLQCIALTTESSPWGSTEIWGKDFVENANDYDQIVVSLDPVGPFTESFLAACGLNEDPPQMVYIQASNDGNVFECSTELSIIDNIPPVAVANNEIILSLVNGSATLTVDMVDEGSYDSCTDVMFSLDKTEFTTADIGSNTVVLTVTDLNGNYNQVFSNVVVDNGSGCNLAFVIFPEDIEIFDESATIEDLTVQNLQDNYGYSYQEVHPYTIELCDGIAYTYEDLYLTFDFGVKAIRTWTAVDWYTTEIKTHIQLIKLYTDNTTSLACNDLEAIYLQNGSVTVWPADVLEGGPYDYDNMTLAIFDVDNTIIVDNLITSDYIGQTLTYTITDNSTGNSCFGQIAVQNYPIGDVLTVIAPTIQVDKGESICIPLTVYNFEGVQSGSGTINWDPEVISYTGFETADLEISFANFNELNAPDGELKFIWFDINVSGAVNIPDGGAIFEMCFDVIGENGDISPITLKEEGSLSFEWFDGLDDVLPQELINGKVTIGQETCVLEDEDINYPLSVINLPDFNGDLATLTPDYLVEAYGFALSEVLVTWQEYDCLLAGYSIEDDYFNYGNGIKKVVRNFTVIDWNTYTGSGPDGIWTFTQIINTGLDQASLICDFLPRTADVVDCEFGHTLADDVEWPADLSIADYRIEPEELIAFSMVDPMDAEPNFYNSPDDYEASYVDLLVELNQTSLVIGRVWTVSHETFGFTWTYNQSITVDFSDFENLVTVNTYTNRVMPGVTINGNIITDDEGEAQVEGIFDYDVTYEDELRNGLNVLDLILIQRHILGEEALTGLQLLAADVNQDNSIKASDLSMARKQILGIDSGFPQWRFFDNALEGPSNVIPKASLLGIKGGDIDDNAILQGQQIPTPEDIFQVEDVLLNIGETYTIPVYLENAYEIYGFDFRAKIDTNQVKVINVESDYFAFQPSFDFSQVELLIIMNSDPTSTTEIGGDLTTPIFTLEIEAKQNSLLSLAIDMENEFSYLADSNLDLVILGGEVGNMIGTHTTSEELSSLMVYPNPTSQYLNFDMSDVNVSGDIAVSIFGLDGRLVLSKENSTQLDVSTIPSGMYYYKITVDSYSKVGKFMVIK
ncbi:MAG: T9SS type A sorting domain-containing protein [Saprospiraceae bacterium]|nr:T9SS type A sorting domain-containing protein [Saprospiraceae bacterium]